MPSYLDKTVPAKRDIAGEEKDRQQEVVKARSLSKPGPALPANKGFAYVSNPRASTTHSQAGDKMDVNEERSGSPHHPKHPQLSGHSAAQSFFGKPIESTEESSTSDIADEAMSSSEEDEIDLQQDLALLNAKFERQKRILEGQLADLSAREYRATTPLESIARLAHISEKDLKRLQEHQDMDLDEPTAMANANLLPPATHSSGSEEGPDLLTPKGETTEAIVDIQSNEEDLESVRRLRKPSPEAIALPYLVKDYRSFHENDGLGEHMDTNETNEESQTIVLEALEREEEDQAVVEEEIEDAFRSLFNTWRQECEDLEREREEQERIERQQSVEPGPDPDASMNAPPNPPMEGRRLHKFSSEYEIEQVLKQSEETARLEQERQDRESRKLQADMEKEARVPNQQTDKEFRQSIFIDANGYRDPEVLTAVFSYLPPPDNFTENEQQIFIAAFKEAPKKWGQIASLLPGRAYYECIHHYYAKKWDGRFRDKTKKLKGGGRGRGRGNKAPLRGRGLALIADLGHAEDINAVPNVSDSGRPKRAAAPTTFGEREQDSKAALAGPSPAKKAGAGAKTDSSGDGAEKPGKRRKGMGENPGRKAKNQQPLLAAAPSASPSKHYLQDVQMTEDTARDQNMEDASLLPVFPSGLHGFRHGDGQMIYHDAYTQSVPLADETDRSKQTSSTKSGASSYWSVTEKEDFKKYIAHFGTDFAAIATHMGTKTQTMIKNYYQRKVDGGDEDSLKDSAGKADKRRERGEELGPPPTPTPIVKRKYDSNPPQTTGPRPIAPHTDAMEVEENVPPHHPMPLKHVSPPQYPVQPRFPPSGQATPIPARRAMASPAPSTTSPAVSTVSAAAPPRAAPQHPLGQRIAILSDQRPESRPGIQSASSVRFSQELPPRGHHQQAIQVPDPQYIRDLKQEQERAFRMQEQQIQQEQLQRPALFPRSSVHGSPANPPLQAPPHERKSLEEGAPTPPPNTLRHPPFSTASFTQSIFSTGPGSLATTSLQTSLMGRTPFNPSPPKKEEPRPGSGLSSLSAPTPAVTAPPPDPPKRSNLLSILNSEPEEPKAVKRESVSSVQPRAPSPIPANFLGTASSGPQLGATAARRETFGQPSLPQSHFQRSAFPSQSQPPMPPASTVKRESSSSSTPLPKVDWTSRVLGPTTATPPPNQPSPPILDRDSRAYLSHRSSTLSQLNQPMRANPSPPPISGINHSRTPSLTTQAPQSVREQHPALAGPVHLGGHTTMQGLHPNPYGQSSSTSGFAHQPPPQAQPHAHHAHSNSIGSSLVHHRAPSREDGLRQQDPHSYLSLHEQRERDEFDRRRKMEPQLNFEGQRGFGRHKEYERQREFNLHREFAQRDADLRYQMQRPQQQEQDRQFPRGASHHPLHLPPFNAGTFAPSRPGGLGPRDQAIRETEAAIEGERRALQDDSRRNDRTMMMRERETIDIHRRGFEESLLYSRHTPLGGGFPPPPARR